MPFGNTPLARLFFLTLSVVVHGWHMAAIAAPGQADGSYRVGYLQNQDENDDGDLKEQFEKMELRLRELENDVADRLQDLSDVETDEEVDERLNDLEESVESNSDSISKIDDTIPGLVHAGHKKPKMELFGRIHIDYWAFPGIDATVFPLEGGNPQDRFGFRRMRVGVKGNLNDNMFYKYEGEFAEGINPSYRDAYLGFDNLPYLNRLIFGNHKRPYGLDHLNSSRYNVFIERPLIIEGKNQDARRLGISSSGFSDDLRFNWRYGVWEQEITQTKFGYIGDHYQLEGAARIAATPWYDECSGGRGYAHFAISGVVGYPDGLGPNNQARFRTRPEARSTNRWLDTGPIAGADTNMLLGLETVINVGRLQFVAEYMRKNIDRLDFFGPDLQFHGGYFYVSYFLTGEHMPWDRKSGTLGRIKPHENFFSIRDCDCQVQRGWGAWQVAARYSHADFNDDNINGGQANAWTFALNWYWNPNARMQFNYIVGEIDRQPIGFGDYHIIGTRFMVDF